MLVSSTASGSAGFSSSASSNPSSDTSGFFTFFFPSKPFIALSGPDLDFFGVVSASTMAVSSVGETTESAPPSLSSPTLGSSPMSLVFTGMSSSVSSAAVESILSPPLALLVSSASSRFADFFSSSPTPSSVMLVSATASVFADFSTAAPAFSSVGETSESTLSFSSPTFVSGSSC